MKFHSILDISASELNLSISNLKNANNSNRKETHALITYVYSGQVNIKQQLLEDFFNTAKALKIKGVIDSNCAKSIKVV